MIEYKDRKSALEDLCRAEVYLSDRMYAKALLIIIKILKHLVLYVRTHM